MARDALGRHGSVARAAGELGVTRQRLSKLMAASRSTGSIRAATFVARAFPVAGGGPAPPPARANAETATPPPFQEGTICRERPPR